jgi:hypothetical protein
VSSLDSLSGAKRALIERALLQRKQTAAASNAIPHRSGGGPAPLSFAQQRMWFLSQWDPRAPTFNGARAIRLWGRLDQQALEHALVGIVERHESLRTVVAGDREPTQVVLDSWSFSIPIIDADVSELSGLLRNLSREPFDLSVDLMLRATLIRLAEDDHVLLVRMHHIAADAHSDRVLFAELAELYAAQTEGRLANLPELPIQYTDFAVWQREQLRGGRLDELVAYWSETLDGAPALLRLPTDRPRRPLQRHAGAHHEFALDNLLAEGLTSLGREQGATFFMTVLAGFATLLYRLGGEDDVVIGSPIANRNNVELDGLIGFFTNTIALRVKLGGNPSFREVVSRAREAALGAYAHQDLPFDKVVEALSPRRDPSYNPLFQVNFRAQGTERPGLALAGLRAESIPVDIGFSRFDLALELERRSSGLSGYFEYDLDLFDCETVSSFVEALRELLQQAVADPDSPILALALPRRAKGRASTLANSITRRRQT